ncbi:hypothetical protein CUC53_00525 [Aeromonas cavernicola]|uniref:DUF5666 domain-containing protein n=1 Tax=Aeromonas cavernicola TaxID=1006623 RepID=A0A2H9U9L8_9GAMM|nr:hypothetical protein CUC53_00525 [Aeromonas cavernicola]
MATEIDLEGKRQPILTAGQQFKLAGLASWDGEQLTINGIPFLLDGVTRFEGGLNQSTLGGRWVELDGIVNQGMNLVREVEPDVQDDELELTGTVSASDNSLWGYHAADGSLQRFAGQWVALDCDFDGNVVSNCRRDD